MSLNVIDVADKKGERYRFTDSYSVDHKTFKDYFEAKEFIDQLVDSERDLENIAAWIDEEKLLDVPFVSSLATDDLVAHGLLNQQLYASYLPKVVIQSAVGENSTVEMPPRPPLPARQQSSGKSGGRGGNSVSNDGNSFNTDNAATGGDPVAMFNGEELLTCDDVLIPGTDLYWQRRYRSSRCSDDTGMGRGWRHGFDYRLEEKRNDKEEITHWIFTDNQGNPMEFEAVDPGAVSYQRRAGASMHHHVGGHWLITLRDGRQLKFAHIHKSWCCIQLRFPQAVQLDFKYSLAAKLIAVIQNGAEQLWVKYNRDGELVKILRPAPSLQHAPTLVEYEYDSDGHLISAVNGRGEKERYSYRDDHLIMLRQRASGLNHHFVWEGDAEQAKCVRQHSDDGYYDYRFSFNGKESNYRDAQDHLWQFVHDDEGNLSQLLTPEGNVWYYEYNEFQQKTVERDPCGNQTLYQYNRYGQLVSEIRPDNHVYEFAYNALGQCVALTNPAKQTWRNHYNSLGLLTHSAEPDGRVTYYHYDPKGRVKEVSYPTGNKAHWWWNSAGQPVAFRKDNVLQRYHYNARGQLDAIAYADGSIAEMGHNDVGQLVKYTLRHEDMGDVMRCHEYRYDSAGRVSGFVLDGQRGCQLVWGEFAQPEIIARPDDSELHFSYDKSRQMVSIERSDGHGFAFSWTPEGRVAEQKDKSGSFTRYEYDPCGRPVQIYQAEQQIKLEYNANGRVTQVRASNANAYVEQQYRYDVAGRLSTATNAHQTVVVSYHRNGMPENVWQHGRHIQYEYDERGLCSVQRFPDGQQCHLAYNDVGQLIAITLDNEQQVNLGYDELGRVNEISTLHGRNTHNTEQRIFDGLSRLVAQQWPQHARSYEFDAQHRLSHVEDSVHGSAEYHYDNVGQICRELAGDNEITYPLNSYGNRKDAEYQGDRLTAWADYRFAYDGHGNQCYQSSPKGEQHRIFNALNQLISLNNNRSLTEYQYDALGRRSRKISEHGTIDYFWEGNHLIGEQRDGRYRWYVYLPGTFIPLLLIEDDQLYLYRCNQVGAPIALVDTKGKEVWRARYTTWGEVTVELETIYNPLRFQGQYFDEESGLHYNLTRYYDPLCGRFIQPDPIGVKGGVNLYQYAPNPVQWIDPLGMSCSREDGTNVNGGNFNGDNHNNVERDAMGNELGGDSWLDNACWMPDLPEPDYSKAKLKKPAFKVVVEVAGKPAPHSEHLTLEATSAQEEQKSRPIIDQTATHRSLNTFECVENEPKDLYLTIPFEAHGEPMKLKLAEGITPVDEGEEQEEWPTVMVPVRLLAYRDKDKTKDNAADLRGGYVYLFWKEELWRELAVDKFGCYRDINIVKYREEQGGGSEGSESTPSDSAEAEQAENAQQSDAEGDENSDLNTDHLGKPILRQAHGFGQEQFWVPYKIEGEAQTGENGFRVLFTPDQLTFDQISKFEGDQELLYKKSVPLDEIAQYSGEKGFSEGEHIHTAQSKVLPISDGDDMPWLTDIEEILDHVDDTNTVYGYVDGHNAGLRVQVEIGASVEWDEDVPRNQVALLVDKNSEWRKAIHLYQSTRKPLYLEGRFIGIPDDGLFSLYLINGNSFEDRELLFTDKTYSEMTEDQQATEVEPETTAGAVTQEDIDAYQDRKNQAFNHLFGG
ncbi:RHS repeat-associated core domain-containing protein [Thaumasiovibrio subtropicus]|uniref:RHS repeat-associated core domain-containing protein n=1 Tax=Thaumasiovibrio subtropicus TaxID=1891207 RepID=UPI000B34E112|nr:RHS repeat-associated core domain-containing protein [Thaumasiovibrio subtropicus]